MLRLEVGLLFKFFCKHLSEDDRHRTIEDNER